MSSPSQSVMRKLWKKTWVKVVSLFFVVILLFFILAPIGAKIYLASWLEKNGADRASIESLRFNPFTTRMTVKGIDVVKGGQSLIKNSNLIVDIGLPSIFNRDLRIEKVEYTDVYLDIEQQKDGGWRIGTITTPHADKEESEQQEIKESPEWNVLADHLLLTNCTVHFTTPELDFTLAIERAELKKFTTHENRAAADLQLAGRLNERPVNISLQNLQVRPNVQFEAEISIEEFDLAGLEKLLAETLPLFSGHATIKGSLQLAMAEGGIKADYDGLIQLSEPKIGQQSWDTAAELLTYKGEIDYSMMDKAPIIVHTDGLLSSKSFTFSLTDSSFSTSESSIDFKGKTEVQIAEELFVQHDGELLIGDTVVDMPGLILREKALSWQGKTRYDSKPDEQGIFVKTDGSLALEPLSLKQGDDSSFIQADVSSIAWQGGIRVGKQDEMTTLVEVDGGLEVGGLAGSSAAQEIQFSNDLLKLETNAKIGFGQKLGLEGLATLGLSNLQLRSEDETTLLVLEKLDITDLDAEADDRITVAEITAGELTSHLAGNMPLDLAVGEIRLADLQVEQFSVIKSASLGLKEIAAVSSINKQSLVTLDDIEVNTIQFTKEKKLSIEGVEIEKLVALAEQVDAKSKGIDLEQVKLTHLGWGIEEGVAAERLEVAALQVHLVRDKEGKLELVKQLQAMQEGKSVTDSPTVAEESAEQAELKTGDTQDTEKTDGTIVKLSEFLLVGDNRIGFEDNSLAVPYTTELVIDELRAIGIDSSSAENQVDLLIKGQFDERAPFELKGTVAPFGKDLAMDLGLSLKNYPLNNLSSYTVQSVGTALSGGQLKITSDIKLAKDELDMKNTLDLRQLETETISKELAAELNNELPIPLDAALALLRDSKGDISLSIPFSGPLSDLDVGISDVLITALSKAIIPAASGYLMYALGPYGALAYVGAKVGEKMLEVKLPPVEFLPASVELTEKHREYLDRIGTILKERPEMDLQICPRASAWEMMTEEQRNAVKEQTLADPVAEEKELLQATGQQRGEIVKAYLAQQHAIEETRLLVCDTVIELEKKSIPRIMLQM